MPASEKEFKMPPIEVGRSVVWYADSRPDTEPSAAIVCVAKQNNVDLVVMDRDIINVRPRDGVMHVDDPRVKIHPDERGAWDYTDEDKRRMAWERDVESRLAALEKPPLKKAS